MVRTLASVNVKMSQAKLAAVNRGAKRLGLTPAQYVKHLIEGGLAREGRIRETPFEVLLAPWRQALKSMTEKEIDDFVEKARRTPELPPNDATSSARPKPRNSRMRNT